MHNNRFEVPHQRLSCRSAKVSVEIDQESQNRWVNQLQSTGCISLRPHPSKLSQYLRLFSLITSSTIGFAHLVRLSSYIDDFLSAVKNQAQIQQKSRFVIQLLSYLGFLVHPIELKPLQDNVYIGARCQLHIGILGPPEDRYLKAGDMTQGAQDWPLVDVMSRDTHISARDVT